MAATGPGAPGVPQVSQALSSSRKAALIPSRGMGGMGGIRQ